MVFKDSLIKKRMIFDACAKDGFMPLFRRDVQSVKKFLVLSETQIALQKKAFLLVRKNNVIQGMLKRVEEPSREYEILSRLHSILPRNFVRPIERGDGWYYMEHVSGLSNGLKTVRDVFKSEKTPVFLLKTIILQILCVLITLQNEIPGFAHNDLKLDNIMLRFSSEDLVFPMHTIQMPLVDVVFIDTETVTWNERQDVENLVKVPKEVMKDFGLCIPTWSSWTDAHLVFSDMLFNSKNKALSDFLSQVIPFRLLSTFADGNILVSKRNRLTDQGRIVLNELLETGECMKLDQIINHDFLKNK